MKILINFKLETLLGKFSIRGTSISILLAVFLIQKNSKILLIKLLCLLW